MKHEKLFNPFYLKERKSNMTSFDEEFYDEDFSESDKEYRTKKAKQSFKKGYGKEFRRKQKIQRQEKESQLEVS